jgi:hypothetical protein
MAWNIEIENKLMKDTRSFIDPTAADEPAESAAAKPAEPSAG